MWTGAYSDGDFGFRKDHRNGGVQDPIRRCGYRELRGYIRRRTIRSTWKKKTGVLLTETESE